MARGRPRGHADRVTRPDRYRGKPAPAVRPGRQPELPAIREWSEVTQNWWEDWGNSEYAPYLSPLDWQLLLDAALLHHALYVEGDLKAQSPLRVTQNNVRETAERRIIQHKGVIAVRPVWDYDGEVVEAVEPRAVEAIKSERIPVSREDWEKYLADGLTMEEMEANFYVKD